MSSQNGSGILECLVALLLTVTAAAAAVSSLRTATIVQERLEANRRLLAFATAIDTLDSASAELEIDAVTRATASVAERLKVEHCKIEAVANGSAHTIRCRANAPEGAVFRTFRLPSVDSTGGR